MKNELISFTETTVFTKQFDKIASLEVLFDLQNELLQNPHKGDLIQGTGGARKARIGEKAKGIGKSGGYRYIYVYFERAGSIYLLLFYSKREQDSIGKEEKELIAGFIEQARRNLRLI